MTDISNTSTKISRYIYLDMYKRYRAWTDKNKVEPNKIMTEASAGVHDWAYGVYKNLTISLPKRSDTDISNRSSQNVNGVGFKVDKEIKLFAPLKNNLSAYRVRG